MSSLTAIAFFVAVVQPAQEIGGCSTPSFAEAADSPFAGGIAPNSVAVGDFDLDGKPDLAIANFASNDVTIRLGDGMGGFPDDRSSTIGAFLGSESVAVGDLNLDGKLDLAVANSGSFEFPIIEGNVTIHLGDGTGRFPAASSSTVDVGGFPFSVAIGDLNLDGKPDLAVVNSSNHVTIRLGDGTGAFPDADSSTVSLGYPSNVAIGDLDLDGKPDLVVLRSPDAVTICLGDGTGGFPEAGQSTVGAGASPLGLAIGDLDLDGKPDLAIANVTSDGDVTIRLADAPGEFPDARSSTVSAGDGTRAVAIGDFNLDGNPDLAIASFTLEDDDMTIRLGDGTGGFPDAASATFSMGLVLSLALGDFDLDGKPDLAVACQDPEGVTVLRNTCDAFPCIGTSLAEAADSPFAAGTAPFSVAVEDLNLDGKPDLAIANNASNDVTIRLGDGTGGFPDARSSTVGAGSGPRRLVVGDLNRDGKPDLAIANFLSNDVTIRLGDGAGGFPDADSSTVAAGSLPNSMAIGDLNLDGKSDLVFVNPLGLLGSATIRLGDGAGGFPDSSSSTVGTGANPSSVAIGDLNLDGKPDLVFTNSATGDVMIRLGDGAGGFPDSSSSMVGAGSGPSSVAIEDLNQDGKPDLAVANSSDKSVTIRLGDGTGQFPDSSSSLVELVRSPHHLVIGDLNLDGKLDFVAIYRELVMIRLGDGTGGFPDAGSSTIGGEDIDLTCLALRDVDLDGKPDLTIGNADDDSVMHLLNTCSSNRPPLADAGEAQIVECAGGTTQVTLEGSSSSDPDEDLLTYSWSEGETEIATGASPTVSLATGSHDITLTVTDPDGLSSTAEVTVDVVDTTAPTITLTTNVISLSRPNHKYVNFTVAALASGASDGCDSAIDLADVVISNVSSDEPENANGNGDGNTTRDIVIATGCRSVQLRNERADARNGRVYTITLKVKDTAGNVGTATRRVFVPVVSGVPARDDGAGAGYTVQGCNP